MTADPTYPVSFQVRQDGSAAVPSGASLDIESGGSLKIAGTALTGTATELNRLAGVTAGTGAAGKALITDASNTISVQAAPTSATPGTLRTIIGEIVPTPATTITSGTLVGVRGHCSFPTGKTVTGGAYLMGAQGKLTFAGTMNHADSRLAAVFAQLDTTGATLTTGQISALWVDHGAGVTGAGGGQFNMVRITNTVSGSKPNAIIYAHSNATNVLDLSAPGGTMDWLAAAGTSANSAGKSDGCAAGCSPGRTITTRR